MRDVLSKSLSFLWRVWFYVCMIVIIIVLSPLLICLIWSEKQYKTFFKVARFWALCCFYAIGMRYRIDKDLVLEKGRSYMLVANHTSMLDIMLMLILNKNNPFVFVGKAELARIPVFGFFYKKTCILVDRNDSKSRNEVFTRAQAKLNTGLSICIFPEGGVNDDRTIVLDEFKNGAFRLAVDHQIPIVVRSFHYLRYMFPFVNNLGYPGVVPVKLLDIIPTQGLVHKDVKLLKHSIFDLLYHDIVTYEKQIPYSIVKY